MNGQAVIFITGIGGDIGSALAAAFKRDYQVVGLDIKGKKTECPCLDADLTSDASVSAALAKFRERYGARIASVIHLAAYSDFTGEDHSLYEALNVAGTHRLLQVLQGFQVEQFIYSGTMLVHQAVQPGERVNERTPIRPKWIYPQSKARAEDVIRNEHGAIPYVLLHLAGLYDDRTVPPTLAHQITRIYEHDIESHLYASRTDVGQSFIHRDDLVDAFVRTVAQRGQLPRELTLLVGEPDAATYQELQDEIAQLLYGETHWTTLPLPKWIAKAGARIEAAAERAIPDSIDAGKKPFVRPFMMELAQDHYALDITRARELLGWQPRHTIRASLPEIIGALKNDPATWYRENAMQAPKWIETPARLSSRA